VGVGVAQYIPNQPQGMGEPAAGQVSFVQCMSMFITLREVILFLAASTNWSPWMAVKSAAINF
jgi:hypothetical protein